jgi:hypothetical protein
MFLSFSPKGKKKNLKTGKEGLGGANKGDFTLF